MLAMRGEMGVQVGTTGGWILGGSGEVSTVRLGVWYIKIEMSVSVSAFVRREFRLRMNEDLSTRLVLISRYVGSQMRVRRKYRRTGERGVKEDGKDESENVAEDQTL